MISNDLEFLVSPLHSLRAVGFAVSLGIAVDAELVRTVIIPRGHRLSFERYEDQGRSLAVHESLVDLLLRSWRFRYSMIDWGLRGFLPNQDHPSRAS